MSAGTLVSKLKSQLFGKFAKSYIGTFTRRFLASLGFVLIDKRKFMNLDDISQFLSTHNICVETVYDIGAYIGEWSSNAKRVFGQGLRSYMFEPNEVHNQMLARVGEPYFNEVLSDTSETIDFFSVGGTGDSMFRENTPIYANVKPAKRQAVKLDDFVEINNIALPQIIKIDVQGAELKVVNGSQRIISQACVVIMECQLLDRNEGGSQISSILQMMQALNFAPIAISEVHQESGIIQEIDFVFVSKALLG